MKYMIAGLAACLVVVGCAGDRTEKLLPDEDRGVRVMTANMRLGLGYLRDQQYRKALAAFTRAREANPSAAEPYHMLGLLHQQLGEFERSEAYFRKAIQIAPETPEILNNLGSLLCQIERRDEAEEVFLRAASNPLYESPELALTNAGYCVQGAGRLEEADRYYRQALDLNPRAPMALFRSADLSYQEGRYLSARGFLQRYLDIAPNTPQTLLLGARIETRLGNRQRAAQFTTRLKNLFPDSQEAQALHVPAE